MTEGGWYPHEPTRQFLFDQKAQHQRGAPANWARLRHGRRCAW